MTGALDGIRVLDLTHYIAGPYCTKLMADFGADVIKIERPSGDPCRQLGPFPGDKADPEQGALFHFLNMNKRSVCLNLKTDAGREALRRLLAGADLVVESLRPSVLETLGFDFASMQEAAPGISLVHISNFGQTGPYRDFSASDLTLLAMGGEMYSVGVPERPPVQQAPLSALIQSGSAAATAALALLFSSRNEREGQEVDVSIMETLSAGVDRRPQSLLAYAFSGRINPRVPGWGAGYPGGAYPCRDGYIHLSGGAAHWDRIVKMLGEPEFLLDPKWTSPTAQNDPEQKAEFERFFLEWTLERTQEECWRAGQAAHVLCAPLYSTADLVGDSTFRDRGAWVQHEHPVAGGQEYPGRPFLLQESPWTLRTPAPILGQHTSEVLGELGYSPDEIAQISAGDSNRNTTEERSL